MEQEKANFFQFRLKASGRRFGWECQSAQLVVSPPPSHRPPYRKGRLPARLLRLRRGLDTLPPSLHINAAHTSSGGPTAAVIRFFRSLDTRSATAPATPRFSRRRSNRAPSRARTPGPPAPGRTPARRPRAATRSATPTQGSPARA